VYGDAPKKKGRGGKGSRCVAVKQAALVKRLLRGVVRFIGGITGKEGKTPRDTPISKGSFYRILSR